MPKSPTKMTDAELDANIRKSDYECSDMTPRFKYPKKGQHRALSITEWQSKLRYNAELAQERNRRRGVKPVGGFTGGSKMARRRKAKRSGFGLPANKHIDEAKAAVSTANIFVDNAERSLKNKDCNAALKNIVDVIELSGDGNAHANSAWKAGQFGLRELGKTQIRLLGKFKRTCMVKK